MDKALQEKIPIGPIRLQFQENTILDYSISSFSQMRNYQTVRKPNMHRTAAYWVRGLPAHMMRAGAPHLEFMHLGALKARRPRDKCINSSAPFQREVRVISVLAFGASKTLLAIA
jgi:hypothetical protein